MTHYLSDVIKPGVAVGVSRLKVGVRVTGVSHILKPGVHRSRSSVV